MKSKLLFFGDLFYDYNLIQNDILELSDWVKENDFISFGNLEGCITQSSTQIEKRGPNLKSSSYTMEVCKLLNVKGLFLANNHVMDFGDVGLKDTIDLLEKNNIRYCGAGINVKKACNPIIMEQEGKKIGFINCGWDVEETVYASKDSAGCAPKNKQIIIEAINKLKNSADYIIVSVHWGFEYNRLPMPIDIELAHEIIDAGADLIIGHHPHCIQPMEKYKGKYIFYSLGNFYFGTVRDEYTISFKERISNQSDYGLLVAVDIDTNDIELSMIYYDKNEKKSFLVAENPLVLEDITDINYRSFKYYLNAFRRRHNINPILNNNDNINYLKLTVLRTIYFAKKVTKMIIKRGYR